jgi:catecholate siderophore receptor
MTQPTTATGNCCTPQEKNVNSKRQAAKGKNQNKDWNKGQNGNKKGVWPITYKLLAMGTLVAYTAIGSQKISIANAQEPRGGSSQPKESQDQTALPTRRFDIPAGPLADVIGDFEKTSGLNVLMSNEKIRSIPSPGVSGVYTDEQALSHLLMDTGINYRFIVPGSVRLTLATLAQSVTVEALSNTVSLPKYTQSTLDTPQTIGVVSQQVMQEEGNTTLREALRNVAGISLAAGEGGAQGDSLTIRGFTARNDIFLDGMRDFGSYYRDSFNLESIAVLQGPSSVIFGRGSTGGVVSQTSKSPRLEGFTAGSLTTGTDLTRRVTLDVDQPIPALGEHTAFRLNLMGNDSNVADRDIAANRRYGVAPSIEFGINTPTRLTLSYFREWEDDIPDYGIPWFFDHPAPVDRKNYYGLTHGNYLKTGDDVGTVKLEHDFGHSISLRSQLRYANYPREAVITEPQINAPNTPTTPLSQIIVTRNEIAVNSVESFLDEQTDVATFFNTGSLRHTLVAGIEAGRETSDPTRFAYTKVPTTSLLAPNPYQSPSTNFTISSQVHTTALSAAAYALDTVSLGKHWDLTGGIRWDRFSTDYSQTVAPAAAFNRVDEMPTWRGAIVYKPEPNASVYFAYGTSFNPSAETLSLSAANANTPPEKNKTCELGTKWDVLSAKISLAGSVFRTDKTNAREPDPNNPLLNVLGGNQRVDGVEFQVNGYLTSRWELLSSYAYLHGEVVSSNFYPGSVGYPLANVPNNTFNLWTTYKLPWRRLELGGGTNFVDSRTASSTVPLNPTTGLLKQVPGYWVFNAMAEYPISDRLELQVNAYNLANRYYYDEPHPGHIVPGAGRSAMVSLNFKFAQGKGH